MRNQDAKLLGNILFGETGDKINPIGDTSIASVSQGFDSTYSMRLGGKFPSREQFNHFFAGLCGLANEINKKGAGLNWDATQRYSHPAFVNYNDTFYVSLQDSLNQLPDTTNSDFWKEFIDEDDIIKAAENSYGFVRLASTSQIINRTGDSNNIITLAGLLERTPSATESIIGLIKLASSTDINNLSRTVAVSPLRLNERLNNLFANYYTRSYINNNYYTKPESDERYLVRANTDNLYRQDVLYTGSANVNSNESLRTLNVTSFTSSNYRWLKITYSNSGRTFTGRFKTSDLLQTLPIIGGINNLYYINNSNRALYTVNTSNGTSSRVHGSNTLQFGDYGGLGFHNGTLYAISIIGGVGNLFRVNYTNGTTINRIGGSGSIGGGIWYSLASQNGVLYAINDQANSLYTINTTTGRSSRASSYLSSGTWWSLASHNGTLYAINDRNNALYTVATNGRSTRVHATNTLGGETWIGLESFNGNLYAVGSQNRLYTVNASNGTASRVNSSNTLTGRTRSLASGQILIDYPLKGLYTRNGRLNIWRTSSTANTQLIFNLVGENSSYTIEQIVGIP